MNECSALVRDSFIERQLLDGDDEEHSWQEDQVLTENLLKSSHDLCSWIPKNGLQLRRNHSNKIVSQSKPQNKMGGSLRTTTQAQAKRSLGIPFRNVGKAIEFDFKHYHNPKKYIEQYRRFHTFGGPLEKLSSSEINSYGHETDPHAKEHATEYVDENSNYLNLGQPFHHSYTSSPNGVGKHISPPDIELQLQLVSRRPATIQTNGRGNSNQLKYSGSFSGHAPLPNYCALTENAKSRRRGGAKEMRLRGPDAFLYATNVPYKAPHTAPVDMSRRPSLEVHLPHGEKMLLNNSKLYSWEQSAFTETHNGNYYQAMGQQLPRAPYMPGSLIRHLPPAYFSSSTKDKSVDTKTDKSYSDNESSSTGVTRDWSANDGRGEGTYTPMIEEKRPLHTEIMLENFYKQIVAAAEHLQNAQVKAQRKSNPESTPPRGNSSTSIWEPQFPDSVLRIHEVATPCPDALARDLPAVPTADVHKLSEVKGQESPISVSQIIGHNTLLSEKVKKNLTTLDKRARVFVDYSISTKPFKSERQVKGHSSKSQKSSGNSSAPSSQVTNRDPNLNSSRSVPRTILKLCSRHAEVIKREHFMPRNGFPGNSKHPSMSDYQRIDGNNRKVPILKFKVLDRTLKSNTDDDTLHAKNRITRHHADHIGRDPKDTLKYSRDTSSGSPSIDGRKLRTYSKSGQRGNSIHSNHRNKNLSLMRCNTYHVHVGNPCTERTQLDQSFYSTSN